MTMPAIGIREAALPVDRSRLLATIGEYLEWLDMDLSHRGFDAEMAAFDHRFTLPSGMFFLAEAEGEVAGCAGFFRHPGNRAELKRLFVRPAFRGFGLGERLVGAVIGKTAALGFPRSSSMPSRRRASPSRCMREWGSGSAGRSMTMSCRGLGSSTWRWRWAADRGGRRTKGARIAPDALSSKPATAKPRRRAWPRLSRCSTYHIRPGSASSPSAPLPPS